MRGFFEPMIYTFYDHSSIEHHLESRARSGWRADGIGSTIHYRRADPAEVKYAVTYFWGSGTWAPPRRKEQRFMEYCIETGWILVAENKRMKVFCNEDPNAVPLETEPGVQVKNIREACAKGILLSFICGVAGWLVALRCWIPLLLHQNAHQHPIIAYAGLLFLGLALVMTDYVITYFRWSGRAEENAKNRQFTPTWSHSRFQTVINAAMLISFSVASHFVFHASPGQWILDQMIYCLIMLHAFVYPVLPFRLKKKGYSGPLNFLITGGSTAFVVAILCIIRARIS